MHKLVYTIVLYIQPTVIHQLSANVHQFSAENAIKLAQDFYRVQKPCSSIERKYFDQLPVEESFFYLSLAV